MSNEQIEQHVMAAPLQSNPEQSHQRRKAERDSDRRCFFCLLCMAGMVKIDG